MSKCYVADVQEILNEINAKLIKMNRRAIKRSEWFKELSALTPNAILPHWINECFRKKHFDSLNAAKVEAAIRAHLSALGLNRDVEIICVD